MEINNPRTPDKSEIFKISTDWFSVHKHINMLDWSDKLKSLSFPFKYFKIPSDMAVDMVNGIDRRNDFKTICEDALIDSGWNKSFFVKLITRSPKDYLYDGMELKSSEEAYDALCLSMRTAEDLCMLSNIDMCYIIIRPFINIPKSKEFRFFVYGKKIVGISQYHYNDNTIIVDSEEFLKRSIYSLMKRVINNININHFVSDVYIDEWQDACLIEINPFGLSDPCLFVDYASLDGSFKYIT